MIQRKQKSGLFVAYGPYIYDEQEHIQGTHGTIYNLKFSSAFSPRFTMDRCNVDKVNNLIFWKSVHYNQAEQL